MSAGDGGDAYRALQQDWLEALAAIEELREQEAKETAARLAEIHRSYRRVAVLQVLNSVALIVIVVGGLWVNGRQTAKTGRDAARNTTALCALRHDLENRVRQTDEFLHDHPEGFAGIPAATLRTTEQGQIRTIQALAVVVCK